MSDDTTTELARLRAELLASAAASGEREAKLDGYRREVERLRAERLRAEGRDTTRKAAKLAHDIRSAAQGPRLAAELLTEHSVPMVRAKATAIVRGLDKVLALVGTETEGEKP